MTSPIWQGLKNGYYSSSRSTKRWATAAGVLLTFVTVRYVDMYYLRPASYQEKWDERQDNVWAEELHVLMRPKRRAPDATVPAGAEQDREHSGGVIGDIFRVLKPW